MLTIEMVITKYCQKTHLATLDARPHCSAFARTEKMEHYSKVVAATGAPPVKTTISWEMFCFHHFLSGQMTNQSSVENSLPITLVNGR